MVSFTKLRFQPGHFHRWYGITNISLFWPGMVQTPQMIILQVHIRSKNTCCLVASLWKWAFRYDNGLVSTGWQTVLVSSGIHFSDDWIHQQKYSALSISRGHVSHYRDVLMSAMVPQITSMVPFYDVIMSEDHPIAGPYGRDMDVPREFKVGFDVCCIQYTVTFDRDISIIYSNAFSAFSLDFFPVIQHSFPFTKMVVPPQTIQFRVYSIMRDFQHMFCNRFVHTSALKYDNGLVPCGQQVILISNCDPCHWCIQTSWEK